MLVCFPNLNDADDDDDDDDDTDRDPNVNADDTCYRIDCRQQCC